MVNRIGTSWAVYLMAGSLCALLAGCTQQMANQPKYRPLAPSTFFPDGRSARPLVPGTVARQTQQADIGLETYRFTGTGTVPPWAWTAAALGGNPLAGIGTALAEGGYLNAFPFPIGHDELRRGQERYTIFCSVCHDRLGTGHGKIVERGYTPPPSYHTDLARGFQIRGINLPLPDAPVGYYFDVITNGMGSMPDYKSQVPPRDRWLIIAYIRALQFSQRLRLADLPPAEQKDILTELEGHRE
jgi:mono/diheme cytochrome c family protein